MTLSHFLLAWLTAWLPASAYGLSGPVFPPPRGVSLVELSAPGSAGRASGMTWRMTNTVLAGFTSVFWGTTNGGVRLSFDDSTFNGPEILSFNSTASDLSVGKLIWAGETRLPADPRPVYCRCTLWVWQTGGSPLALLDPSHVGLPTGLGGLVSVVSPSLSWDLNFKFEASFTAGADYQPALDFYDANTTGGGTAFSSFASGFYYTNTPPQLTEIPDQSVPANTVLGPLSFTVNDWETSPDALVLSATSSNPTLVAGTNLVFGGSGTNRTILVTPNAGRSGLTRITVTAQDGEGDSATSSFEVLVNTPPTLSGIPDQLVQMNGVAGPVPLTVGDAESAAESLVLAANSSNPSLLPMTNIVFGGAGSNRNVRMTPVRQWYGSSTVTVTVSDGLASASTNFLLIVNSPPQLQANNLLTVHQAGGGTIASALLRAADVESGPGQVTYTVAPGGAGGPPRNGWLRLNGTNLVEGSRFTQNDVDAGSVTYVHNGGCERNDDFTFNVTDGQGGVTPTGQYSTYTFGIAVVLTDNPPVATGSVEAVPLNASIRGLLIATNPDCLNQPLTFRIVTNGVKGTAVITNSQTGGYVYTPQTAQSGDDRFVFQVTDGGQDAVTPAVVSLMIGNQPPVAHGAQFMDGRENTVYTNRVVATDPDLPPQILRYSVESPAAKGTVQFWPDNSGTFTYTPLPGRFGIDVFAYKVSDGALESFTVQVMMLVRPAMLPGRLVVTDKGRRVSNGYANQMIGLVDPRTGDQGMLTMEGSLVEPAGITVARDGSLLVTDFSAKLLRINPTNGAQTVLAAAPQLGMPYGVAVESGDNIAIADLLKGPMRFSSGGTLLSTFPRGSLEFPSGLVVQTNGDWLIADAAGMAGNPAGTEVLRLQPANSNLTVVTPRGFLTVPAGLAQEPSGNLLVANAGGFAGSPDEVVRVDVATGSQTVLSTNQLLVRTFGVAVNLDGEVFTANGNGLVVKVDPTTGGQAQIGASGIFSELVGIALVPGRMPAPRILTITRQEGGFQIRVEGIPGQRYDLERADVLPTPAWNRVATFVAPLDGVTQCDDPASSRSSAFYRAVLR